MKQPTFMDFEASSLNTDSYPIEVAWSNEDGRVESYLIKPEASWIDWDEYAEHEIHGISREQLLDEGISAGLIVQKMKDRLKGKNIYVDGGQFDEVWCERLFDYKGYSGKLPFYMKSFQDLLISEFGYWITINEETMDSIQNRMRIDVGGQHRAAVDVRYLQGVYGEVKMLSEGK